MHLSRKQITLVTTLVAVILVSTAFVGYGMVKPKVAKSSATFGPKIEVSLPSLGNTSSTANVTEVLQIMGVDPSYISSPGMPARGGPNLPPGAFMTLLNQTYYPMHSHGASSVFLNQNFSRILSAWKTMLTDENQTGQNASLDVESSLSILLNGNLSVYTYYNNLPFNPMSLSYVMYAYNSSSTSNNWFNNTGITPSAYSSISYVPVAFNVTPSFDLQNPAYVTSLNATTSGGLSTSSGYSPYRMIGCNPGTYYTEIWSKVKWGPLPFITVHINASYPTANNYLAIAESMATSNIELSINSDQTGVTSSGSVTNQMSTSPSWGGTGSFSAGGKIAQWAAYPQHYPIGGNNMGANQTTAMIWMQHCEYTITHYNIYNIYFMGQNCYEKYLGNATSVAITHVNQTNGYYMLGYGFMSIYFYHFMQNLTAGEPVANLGGLAPGNEIQGGQVWAKSTGYSNAATVMTTITNAALTINTGLGVGLAMICLLAAGNAISFDSDEPEIIADALGLMSSIIGLIAQLVMDFSTISFSTTSSFEGNLYGITSEPQLTGYTYSLLDFESPNPVSFSYDGNTYSFNGPSNFVVAS